MKRSLLCAPRRAPARPRPGTVLVFTMFMMTCLLAMLAFAVDIGYLATVRTEAQRAADSAALAGASALYTPVASLENWAYYLPPNPWNARNEARDFVRYNLTAGRTVDVDLNTYNFDPSGDILVGRIGYTSDSLDLSFANPNAVAVTVSSAPGTVAA